MNMSNMNWMSAEVMKTTEINKFVPSQQAVQAAPATVERGMYEVQRSKKKDKKMSRYYDEVEDRYVELSDILQPQTDLERSRTYLRERVEKIRLQKNSEFYTSFGLRDDAAPSTASEFVKRILDGKYVLEDSTKDKNSWESSRYITWRDPKVKKDEEGYEVVVKALDAAKDKALDSINTKSAEDGLKAFEKFEAFKA